MNAQLNEVRSYVCAAYAQGEINPVVFTKLECLLGTPKREHSIYFKDVEALKVLDVYRVLTLYNITHPCLAHAIKKLLVPGVRNGGKSWRKDIQEAIASLERAIEMDDEDCNAGRG